MSAFVWLDYSERERRKMLDVVDLFGEHDTRDELGIGSVRDAFADMLFPGTGTIMTRVRDTFFSSHGHGGVEKPLKSMNLIGGRGRNRTYNLLRARNLPCSAVLDSALSCFF